MRIVSTGLIMTMMVALSPALAGLELRLTTRAPEQLPFLYPDLRLEVVNDSDESVLFPMNAFHVRLFLETEAGWRSCRPLVQSKLAPLARVDWKELAPGESFPTGIPGSRCAEGKGPSFEWARKPGTYHVKALLLSYAHKIEVVTAGFDGELESNALEIKIREPDGLDAEVIAWSNGSPLRIDVLREFPNSEYAAYAIYPYIRLDEADPKQVSSLIDQGKFPIASMVPDQDERRTLSGADVARWRVEWGERIAREHPGFVFLDEVRVSAALARMSLGDRDKANRTLSDIAENGYRDTSNWVKVFLASRQEE